MEESCAARLQGTAMAQVDKEQFIAAFQNASTEGILEFLSRVIQVHKKQELDHTNDEEFMSECRRSYSVRLRQLREKNDGLRQQRDHLEERPEGTAQSPRLQGERGSERNQVLDFRLD